MKYPTHAARWKALAKAYRERIEDLRMQVAVGQALARELVANPDRQLPSKLVMQLSETESVNEMIKLNDDLERTNAALKARIEELNLGNQPFNAVAAQCFAYRTEIRELKAQISQLESIQATHDSEVAMTAYHTAELERAAIVAYVRANEVARTAVVDWLLDQIESGAHHANRGEGGGDE